MPARILVRAPNWLGDFVMGLGCLHALAGCYPSSTLDIVVRKELADLLVFFPGIHETHAFLPSQMGGFSGLSRLARRLRGRCSSFVSMPDSFAAAMLGFLARCEVRVGYAKEFRSFLLTLPLKKRQGRHRVLEYTGLADALSGKATASPTVSLQVGAHPLFGGPPTPRRVVFHIHSEASSRRMSERRWAELAGRLLRDTRCGIILTGTSRDAARAGAFLRELGGPPPVCEPGWGASMAGRVMDLTGRLPVGELARVLKSADLLVSGDSGPAHLANAVGTPAVVLFGAGDEAKTAPFNPVRLSVVRVPGLPCAPCRKNVCRYGTPACMEGQDLGRVASESLRLLGPAP